MWILKDMIKKLLLASVIVLILDIPYLLLTKNVTLDATKKINGGRDYAYRYYSAILVYLAIGLGLVVLVLPRISKTSSKLELLKQCILYGGIYGLTSYSVFDFTMHFMFHDWTINLAIMDVLWGSILCSLTTFILCLV